MNKFFFVLLVLILLSCACYKSPSEDSARYVLVYSGILTKLNLGSLKGLDSPFYSNSSLQFDNVVEFQEILIHETLKMPVYMGSKYNLYKSKDGLTFYVLEKY